MEEKQSTLFVLSIAVALSIVLGECSPAPTLSEAMSATPETVVESFYNWYVGYPGNSLVDGAYRSSEYLTPEFVRKVAEIVAPFDKGGYDPFLCAQDIPGEFTIEKAVVSGEKASVVVHQIWNPGTECEVIRDVTVALQMVNGQWKIVEVICPEPEQVADELTSALASFNIKRTSVAIAGELAVVLDNMPGQDTNRQVVIVHDDHLFMLTFVPASADYGKVYTQMENLYTMVLNSFHFSAPPSVTPSART